MATEFRLPELGENIEKGDLVKILVSVGDTVAKDQAVVELETDKATLEVPSSVAGKVKQIHVKQGDKVKVGQLILTVDAEDARPALVTEPDKPPRAAAPPQTAPATKTPVESEPVATAPEPSAPARGAVIDISQARATAAEPQQPERPALLAPASPRVRRQARELGVDINEVHGTGPGGRISVEDVTGFAKSIISGIRAPGAPAGLAGTAAVFAPLPDFARWGQVEREAMSNIRRKTAEHMAQAWSTVAQVTQFDQVDITDLEELRSRYSRKAEAAGGKLTITAIAVKVVASALRVFPKFAASIDVAANEIVYKKYAHIGVAVDTDRGLLVPVIRNADQKNIIALSAELAQLAEKSRSKKLTPEEMEGGVFTITNLGGIGGTAFSPIVNHPEVAILGLSRASHQPVYQNGHLEPRLILPVSLSYDHRLIDGADAARFLRWVAEALEQPFLLSLEG